MATDDGELMTDDCFFHPPPSPLPPAGEGIFLPLLLAGEARRCRRQRSGKRETRKEKLFFDNPLPPPSAAVLSPFQGDYSLFSPGELVQLSSGRSL